MTALAWNQSGTRMFEGGTDRGVLYPVDGIGVAWNGLISVSERIVGNESTPIYFDGVKIGDATAVGDFAGTIRAYTYPDEFLEIEGIQDAGNGLHVANQRGKRFGMSYRTMIGNDVSQEAGYKIHILYNLSAIPVAKNYQSAGATPSPSTFEWNVTAVPEKVKGYRPTAHVILDSRQMGDLLLQDIENTLYGTPGTDPTLPDISTLVSFLSSWVIIRITDNFDGTYTIDAPDDYVTMLPDDEFDLIQANIAVIDGESYFLSDTTY